MTREITLTRKQVFRDRFFECTVSYDRRRVVTSDSRELVEVCTTSECTESFVVDKRQRPVRGRCAIILHSDTSEDLVMELAGDR